MHITQGVPIAINVGDMLSLLAMRPLLDNRAILGSEMSLRILERRSAWRASLLKARPSSLAGGGTM